MAAKRDVSTPRGRKSAARATHSPHRVRPGESLLQAESRSYLFEGRYRRTLCSARS